MKKRKLLLSIFLFLFFINSILFAAPKYEKAKVVRVVDGDTIEVNIANKNYKVRLIGVNTPESTTKTEPYGKEASNYTMKMLTGKVVYLESDAGNTDKYGRLLRYVWLQIPKNNSEQEIRNKMFNANLVINGYAQVMTIPPNVKYSNYFVIFQKEAISKNKGLWGLNIYNNNTNNTKTSNVKIVFWTPSGKSYHYDKNCKTLKKSKTILSGTIKEAEQNGKIDPCDICVH